MLIALQARARLELKTEHQGGLVELRVALKLFQLKNLIPNSVKFSFVQGTLLHLHWLGSRLREHLLFSSLHVLG